MTMLLVLVVCHLVVASIANPISKYPFVFLLDVGNEELDKTNTEQIRVSIPGGSLAVRYPAVDTGNLITRVRVTGIDYGTDLKANIIEGGPGYKYVVLVFFGNTGIPYEAVVTLETQPNAMDFESVVSITKTNDSYKTNDEDDDNNSAEDTDDSDEVSKNVNTEQVQPSENVYNYAATDDEHDTDDSKNVYIDSVEKDDSNEEESEENKNSRDQIEDNQYTAQKLQARSDNKYIYYSKYKNSVLDSNEIEDGAQLDEDARMYREDALNDNAYSGEGTVELDQMFNDEEVHNDADKYRDTNNNNFDSDYDSAIAY